MGVPTVGGFSIDRRIELPSLMPERAYPVPQRQWRRIRRKLEKTMDVHEALMSAGTGAAGIAVGCVVSLFAPGRTWGLLVVALLFIGVFGTGAVLLVVGSVFIRKRATTTSLRESITEMDELEKEFDKGFAGAADQGAGEALTLHTDLAAPADG